MGVPRVFLGSVDGRVGVMVMVPVGLGRAVAVPVGSGGMAVTVGFGVEVGLAAMVCAIAVMSRSGVGVRWAWGKLQDAVINSKNRAIKRDIRIVLPSIINFLRRYYSLNVVLI